MVVERADERPHANSLVEEWVFAAWTPDGRCGVISGHRLLGRTAWYWAAMAEEGQPLLHITEWSVPVRRDPFIVKAEQLWAEHTCDAPLEQWSIGNECYATAIDDPDDALGRAYGDPMPIGFDLEWYATEAPVDIEHGFEQVGVVHGVVELIGRAGQHFTEVPAHRWRRWTSDAAGFGTLALPSVWAHTGVRAPFAYPDGTVSDLVLTPVGWRSRAPRR